MRSIGASLSIIVALAAVPALPAAAQVRQAPRVVPVSDGAADPAVSPTLSIQQIDESMRKTLGIAQFATARDSYRRMGRFVARARQKGVLLLAGTDDGNLFDELDAYDSVGMPNAAMLEAATRNWATWLGKDAEFGTVAVGRRADLIVVDGDPLTTMADIRKIDVVVQDGRVVFRK